MADESDEFQDFEGDDWDFTDGESASVMRLIDASPVRPAAAALAAPITNNTLRNKILDEELLDELFPEKKTEITRGAERCEEKEKTRRGADCEVEWAPMALEEHQRKCSNSEAASASVEVEKERQDFVNLFEEMYGGDRKIALSTPSPSSRKSTNTADRFGASMPPDHVRTEESGNSDKGEQLVSKPAALSVLPSPKLIDYLPNHNTVRDTLDTEAAILAQGNDVGVNELFPAEISNMIRAIYDGAVESGVGVLPLLNHCYKILCLSGNVVQTENPIVCSLEAFSKTICALEAHLAAEAFVHMLASNRGDRLELIIAALDDKLAVLQPTWKAKWTKLLGMIPALVKVLAANDSEAKYSTTKRDDQVSLIIDTASSVALVLEKPKTKQGSPLEGWATFHPEKMPMRRNELSMTTTSTGSKQSSRMSSSKKEPRVLIRQYRPSKFRARCKVYNPDDRELTFRPRINNKYRRYHIGEQKQQKIAFAVRMQKDIVQRRLQRLQQEDARKHQEQQVIENSLAFSYIAKGSQRILLRNGMWSESLEKRIDRLAMHRSGTNEGMGSKKKREKQMQRSIQTAAIASRACESLYQRGIDQRRREAERVQEDILDFEHQRNRPKMSDRSLRVMKTRIRQDLRQICADSRRSLPKPEESSDAEASTGINLPDWSYVTFVEFSCVLLYFGFVPDLNTPWEGKRTDGDESEFTLLWHSWMVFTVESTGEVGPKLPAKVLERILFAVILGERIEIHPRLRSRDVQALLRLYRAYYYAKKNSPLKTEQHNGAENPKAVSKLGGTSRADKRGSSRRGRVHYSLHGKPIRSGDSGEADPLSERERLLQEKMEQMREEKARIEIEGCTFHPTISPRPSRDRSNGEAHHSAELSSTFDRLYSDAFQRQNNVLEKYLEAKLHREELEKQDCTVHPSYVNGLTIEERLANLRVALANNTLPVDFHKKIYSMRTAAEMKVLDEQDKAQRLQPAHFKKAKDGRTIVLPFRFATEIRAALGAEHKKNKRVQVSQRPRDHFMKSLRPFCSEQEIRGPTKEIEHRDETEADICLDVHVSPSETHQLCLNCDDDPREAVARFAKRFALNNSQKLFLLQLVEARLEQLQV